MIRLTNILLVCICICTFNACKLFFPINEKCDCKYSLNTFPINKWNNATMGEVTYYFNPKNNSRWKSESSSFFKTRTDSITNCSNIFSQIIYSTNEKNYPDTLNFFIDTCFVEKSYLIFEDSKHKKDSLINNYYKVDTLYFASNDGRVYQIDNERFFVYRYSLIDSIYISNYFLLYPVGVIMKSSNFEPSYNIEFIYSDAIENCIKKLNNMILKDTTFYPGTQN